MSKRAKLFLKIFNREWNKRFQLTNENGTPLEMPETEQGEEELYQKLSPDEQEEMELTEEELEEMELMESIGEYLDSVVEKIESEEEGEKL